LPPWHLKGQVKWRAALLILPSGQAPIDQAEVLYYP
jgi:hypothetical protein